MAIDWSNIGSSVEQAVAAVVGADWRIVAPAARAQLTALVETAQAIETDRDQMSAAEYHGLRLSQQRGSDRVARHAQRHGRPLGRHFVGHAR